VILIRGDCGNGKSAALRALEAAPPAGSRAVYVPVPTLDFAGIARWCLDRLGLASQQEPALALREAARRQRIVLLIDDADLLPLDTALALRHLERDAAGTLSIVAACASEDPVNGPIVALGPPARTLEVAAGKSEEAAAALRDALAPATKREAAASAPTAAPPARAHPALGARAPARSASSEPPPPVVSVPVGDPAPRAILSARAQVASAGRSVPLSMALAMAFAAFLVPVAFGAGVWVGGRQRAAKAAASSEPTATPPVSAAPPALTAEAPAEIAPPAPARVATPRESAPPSRLALSTKPVSEGEPAQRVAVPRAPIEAPTAAPRAPSRPSVRSVTAAPPAPSPRASESEAEWGAPVLISVEPGSDGR
jgi:hypothetical protein